MKRILIPLLIILPFSVFAQNSISDEIIIDQIERMIENSDEDVDFNELIENYWSICENKININNPDELNQLIELHLVNIFIIEKINSYRKDFGDLMTFDELQFVEGIDEMTIDILKPLIVFEKSSEKEKFRAKDLWKYGRHQSILQLEQCLNEKAGYKEQKYLGSPQKMLLRYSFSSLNKLEFGFALEKDAGEKNILDFASFHFLIKDLKFVKTLALGDYQLAFGQGVTLGSGMAFAASGGSLLRKNKKIRASKSANETRYLRGFATTLNYKNLELTLFYSNKKADANVNVFDSLGEPQVVTALQQTGLHRTYSEIIDKHAITKQLFGGNVSYRGSNFQIGFTLHKTVLSCNLIPEPRLYNTFYFRGNSLVNQGVDFYYVLKKIAFYGEAAISDNNAPAALVGTTIQPAGYIDFTVLYRYYDKAYHNFYCNSYASGSSARNEKGLYLSTSITFAPRWQFIATADFPQSDWIKTTAYAPSRTQDYNLQINHQINSKSLFFIQLRYKDKEKNGSAENTYMRHLVHERKTMIRFHVTYPVGNGLLLKNRVEYHTNNSYLVYQDILYNPDNHPFSIAFRYALFDSPQGAVYAYENDILNAFSIGGLYHKGMRIYLLGKVKLRYGIAVNAKIGCTIYSDVNEIGSGLERIEGNVKTDGKLQLVWKL
ncbi:MAG: hypothetical protein IJK92_01110 [Bacteroidales bacterium]|nr:hypothetical protein [Bacteroidales bacterium]